MSTEYRTYPTDPQEAFDQSQSLAHQLEIFFNPLLTRLDAYLDKRLVRTPVQTVASILTFRNQEQGLNLSE